MKQALKADLWLIFVVFIWGSTFVLVHRALQDLSPILFVFLRFCLAFFILWAILFKKLVWTRKAVLRGMILGVIVFTGFWTQTVGLTMTAPSKSAFITSLSVVLVPFVSVILFRIFPSIWSFVGVVIAAVGLWLVTDPRGGLNPGDIWTLACACSFALHIVVTGRFTREVDFRPLVLSQIGTTALLALCCIPLEPLRFAWTWPVFWALLICGAIATGFAILVQTMMQRHTTATHTGLIFSAEPLFAMGFEFAIAGTVMALKSLLGAVLIVAGILVAEVDTFAKRGSKSEGP